jgi:hypothetical protein
LTGAARAQVISPEFFFEQLIAVNESDASFDVRFGRETSAALAHRFEKNA